MYLYAWLRSFSELFRQPRIKNDRAEGECISNNAGSFSLFLSLSFTAYPWSHALDHLWHLQGTYKFVSLHRPLRIAFLRGVNCTLTLRTAVWRQPAAIVIRPCYRSIRVCLSSLIIVFRRYTYTHARFSPRSASRRDRSRCTRSNQRAVRTEEINARARARTRTKGRQPKARKLGVNERRKSGHTAAAARTYTSPHSRIVSFPFFSALRERHFLRDNESVCVVDADSFSRIDENFRAYTLALYRMRIKPSKCC